MQRHIRHLFAACRHSLSGVVEAFRQEISFRQETAVLFAIAALAFFLFCPPLACLLIAAWLGVMALELLNSAIESIADLVSPDFHPLIRRAKDAASGAVCLAIAANLLLWPAALLWGR